MSHSGGTVATVAARRQSCGRARATSRWTCEIHSAPRPAEGRRIIDDRAKGRASMIKIPQPPAHNNRDLGLFSRNRRARHARPRSAAAAAPAAGSAGVECARARRRASGCARARARRARPAFIAARRDGQAARVVRRHDESPPVGGRGTAPRRQAARARRRARRRVASGPSLTDRDAERPRHLLRPRQRLSRRSHTARKLPNLGLDPDLLALVHVAYRPI